MMFEVIDGVIVKYNGPDSVEATSTDPIVNPIAIPEEATSIAKGVTIPYNLGVRFHKTFIPNDKMFGMTWREMKYNILMPRIVYEKEFLCRAIKFPAFCSQGITDEKSCVYVIAYQRGKNGREQ